MDSLYVSRSEQDALLAIDVKHLNKVLNLCLQNRSLICLGEFRLGSCGAYVASELRGFEAALTACRSAKAASKVEMTHRDALRAGNQLASAVQAMIGRVIEERMEIERFRIDDLDCEPQRLSEQLRVVVRYHWRPTVKEEWKSGSIDFTHVVNSEPDYTQPQRVRKPSAASKARDEHDKLRAEWRHLRQLGLHSVREFLRAGGDPAAIPKTFQAITDGRHRLNNFSADFWPRRGR